jgi:hypothetical protein
VLVVGKPGDLESTNLVSNLPPERSHELLEMLKELSKRGV